MVSRRCSSTTPFVAGILLLSASQATAFVAGIATGSCFSAAIADTSCAAIGAWGYDESVGGCKLSGRVRRWDVRLAATLEDADAARAGESGSGSDEEEGAVWARAELPLSNDVQVEQATRAVWQVTNPPVY